MQYVGRAFGSVSKTWNSINPSTLSGAIDVVVVEQTTGDLHCSAFHIRFGKLSLLRPSQKGVDFYVNGNKVDVQMKLGEGGEAFFVFETEADVPESMLTSPVVSPQGSPASLANGGSDDDMEDLDISKKRASSPSGSPPGSAPGSPTVGTDTAPTPEPPGSPAQSTDDGDGQEAAREQAARQWLESRNVSDVDEIVSRLAKVNTSSAQNDNGQVIIDMTGYKPGGQNTKELEKVVQQIISHDIDEGADGGPDCHQHTVGHGASAGGASGGSGGAGGAGAAASGAATDGNNDPSIDARPVPSDSDDTDRTGGSHRVHYVKTLRLTSDLLKSLDLKKGINDMKFVVRSNKATVTANIFLWDVQTPVVISDIDGTITRSDALGHVMTMIGRDWTHAGVGKLFTDIANNGYNIMYLTSRAVGQADITRGYLRSVQQDGYKLPQGPVILSPDRTMAALRREMIMRKPEIFKMACLRDIMQLYDVGSDSTPFYAGFGNRITDGLSYRSVGVPSTKIFTINSDSEVHMELLELTGYKSSYVLISDLVDHFFPPVDQTLPRNLTNDFSDANFWREPLPELLDDESGTEAPAGLDYEGEFDATFGGSDEDDSSYRASDDGSDDDDGSDSFDSSGESVVDDPVDSEEEDELATDSGSIDSGSRAGHVEQ